MWILDKRWGVIWTLSLWNVSEMCWNYDGGQCGLPNSMRILFFHKSKKKLIWNFFAKNIFCKFIFLLFCFLGNFSKNLFFSFWLQIFLPRFFWEEEIIIFFSIYPRKEILLDSKKKASANVWNSRKRIWKP